MTPQKYRMLKDSDLNPDVKAGDIVYEALDYDYGLARDDTLITKIKHISVTTKEDGSSPLFTVKEKNLEKIS